MNKEIFKTSFQEFIYIRTYSRWVDEIERRESWRETVTRYCAYMKEKLGDKISDKEFKDVYNAIYNLEVMPSMRALWSAGEAADQDNFAVYNCSFTTVEKLKDFSEMLYILMHGTGVGFSVERKYTNNLPVIKEKNNNKTVKIVFEDSKMGWAKGFETVLNCLWEGTPFECDYSKVRPRGARLKTFGGRASGPEPLKSLVEFVTHVVEENRGFQLQPIDVHDICCKIAEIVVVGGVRRSALISLSDLTDNQMANAKMGDFSKMHPQRHLANNSVAYTRTPDIVSFIDEWKNLYRSKSGERGIFNRIAAQKKGSENHRRDGSKIVGTNPCLTGDTIIAVADGRNGVSIKQLAEEGLEFLVYSAKEIKFANQFGESERFKNFKPEIKKAKAFKSGTKPIIEILLSDGSSFKCTPDHLIATKDGRWIEAQYIEGEQLAKFYSFTNLNSNRQYRTINSITDGHNRQYRLIWEFYNGQYDGNKFNIDHINEDTTDDNISNLQLLTLEEHIEKSANSKLGDKNPIFKMDIDYRKWINKKRNILANGKKYGWSEDKIKGALEIFLLNNPKPEFVDDNVYFNENIYALEVVWNGEIEDVYDLTVEDNHNFYIITKTDDACYFNCSGILVHNCGEILMRSKSLCNLTEVIVRPNDDFNSLKRKIQIAATLGTWQASLTCFKYVDSDWKINCDEEALLGVSLSGVCDNPILGTVNDTAKKWLSDLKHVAIQTNKKIAQKIGINRAAAITCVKPSGTVSQLVDCAPGIHSRLTATGYYIRRVRISVTDPLYRMLRDLGVQMKCEVGQSPDSANTWVIEFPCKAPKETLKQTRNAKEQLEFWRMYHQFWCEHNPSVTIYVEENEWLETAAWVYKHFDEIGGLTFLPVSDHVYQLAPFEDIDKETYDEMVQNFPKIDFNKLKEYEAEDQTTGSKEYACVGGACEIR